MQVICYFKAMTALSPGEKITQYPLNMRLSGPQMYPRSGHNSYSYFYYHYYI